MTTLKKELRFKDGPDVLTLWPEKILDDGYVVGWCPERNNTIVVHPLNIVPEDDQ